MYDGARSGELRCFIISAPRGGLREHGVRAVTYASSRQLITHRNLPNMSEVYLGMRYFTSRQVREMLVLRAWGTLPSEIEALRCGKDSESCSWIMLRSATPCVGSVRQRAMHELRSRVEPSHRSTSVILLAWRDHREEVGIEHANAFEHRSCDPRERNEPPADWRSEGYRFELDSTVRKQSVDLDWGNTANGSVARIVVAKIVPDNATAAPEDPLHLARDRSPHVCVEDGCVKAVNWKTRSKLCACHGSWLASPTRRSTPGYRARASRIRRSSRSIPRE